MKTNDYIHINTAAWEKWAKEGFEWTIPISHDEFLNAKEGNWDVTLATDRKVPHEWFPPMNGCDVLGLASGGAQQIPIFSALGANCTVLDICQSQLNKEIMVANREGYTVNTICKDMSSGLPFDDNSFDMIFHPASNTYVPKIDFIWTECYRVLRPGGVLLCGLDYGINFLFYESTDYPPRITHKLPFSPFLDFSTSEIEEMIQHDDCVQFSHSIEEQIGGQLQAGFLLTALIEDRNKPGHGTVRDFISQYLLTRAIKPLLTFDMGIDGIKGYRE